ncbi:cupin domain-containing protein [Nonomuraea sp. NPDC046570]|uniref:cupin domain-containing protein n=1 Tax=Nonomuraea sp. NPDC046570 TaxID=3155255 RepID=UPI0033DB2130
MARLLDEHPPGRVITLRRGEQRAIEDRTGWERRILSPALPGVEFEFIRTAVPTGVTVGSFAPHAPGSREYVAVESGALTVTLDGRDVLLGEGDALYYAGDCVHAFANHGERACVYYTAMDVGTSAHQMIPEQT